MNLALNLDQGSEFNPTEKNHILFGKTILESFYSVEHLEHYFISYSEYMRKNLTVPKQDSVTPGVPGSGRQCPLKGELVRQHHMGV